jgi:uncharacterized membrane protein YcaP (DUF421 family)
MDYVTILDAPPLESILFSVFQTATIYVFVLAGLKLVGRRVFGEKSPQDLVILFLIAEACDLGLSDEQAGYWGTIASVTTILVLGWLSDRIPFIRSIPNSRPVCLFRNNRLERKIMETFMIEESDLEETAREYGLSSYKDFDEIILEGDGRITGIMHMPHMPGKKVES